jgi:hypothetical protein
MAITGRLPLKKLQAAIEVTPGTILPATRFQPVLSADLVRHRDRELPAEVRGSFIKNYGNDYVTKDYWEIQGMTFVPTYEDLPWFLQAFASHETASATNVTAYDYTFTPTVATDDLKTVNWEVSNDTANFSAAFGLGTRIRIEGGSGKASMATADYIGATITKQAITSNMSVRVTEPINMTAMKAYIDSATIGTTQVYTVLDFSFELTTGQKQLFVASGSNTPYDSYRGETRMAKLDATLVFSSTTEYDAFAADTERKIRFTTLGSTIAGSSASTTKILDIDWYGKYSEAPFGDADGLVVLKVSGESIYDSGAGWDWRIRVRNDLATLV